MPVPEVRLEEWLYIGVVDDLVQGDFSYLSLKLYSSIFDVLVLHSIYKSCVDFQFEIDEFAMSERSNMDGLEKEYRVRSDCVILFK